MSVNQNIMYQYKTKEVILIVFFFYRRRICIGTSHTLCGDEDILHPAEKSCAPYCKQYPWCSGAVAYQSAPPVSRYLHRNKPHYRIGNGAVGHSWNLPDTDIADYILIRVLPV